MRRSKRPRENTVAREVDRSGATPPMCWPGATEPLTYSQGDFLHIYIKVLPFSPKLCISSAVHGKHAALEVGFSD